MDFRTLLLLIAESYDTMAKGGAKPAADKMLLGVATFLGALQAVAPAKVVTPVVPPVA
jgi:hypothetical protein